MIRRTAAGRGMLGALLLPVLLGGCAAAMLPAAVSTMVVSKKMKASREKRAARAEAEPVAAGTAAPQVATRAQTPSPAAAIPESAPVKLSTPAAIAAREQAQGSRAVQVVPGMTALPPPSGMLPPSAPVAAGAAVPAGMQYLYGSGEAAATSQQAYRALGSYLASIKYRRPETLRQVVISDGGTLAAPYFEPCGKKPPAVVLDVDETVLLNLGYEADEASRKLSYDDTRWQRWEATGATRVAAVPGAREALAQARAEKITVIFNSNRTRANAAATEAALNGAGLGPVKYGETLWLKGDDGGGSAKDERRWAIATGYCVVALVGDQLGDFSDLFNDPALSPALRRAAAAGPGIADLWGNGWFVLPNPVYGTALKGGLDDIFPPDKRWTDPGPASAAAKE